jgi:hypothetical protein
MQLGETVMRTELRRSKRDKLLSAATAEDLRKFTRRLDTGDLDRVATRLFRALRDHARVLRIPIRMGDIDCSTDCGRKLTIYFSDRLPRPWAELVLRFLHDTYWDLIGSGELGSRGSRKIIDPRKGPLTWIDGEHQGVRLPSVVEQKCDRGLAAYELEWIIARLQEARRIPERQAEVLLDLVGQISGRPKQKNAGKG